MIQKVVFPSFRDNEYTAFEMRQLVSALELRFQSLESNVEGFFPSVDDDEFARVGHTHVESEITDLNHTTSIFELDDVIGTPDPADILAWNGTAFETVPQGAFSLDLDDLNDVNAGGPADGQALVFDISTLRWVPGDPPAGIDKLLDLTDTDIDDQVQGDFIYNADGTEWQATGPDLHWFPDDRLQLGNDITINWYDAGFASVEFLGVEFTAATQEVWGDIDDYTQIDSAEFYVTEARDFMFNDTGTRGYVCKSSLSGGGLFRSNVAYSTPYVPEDSLTPELVLSGQFWNAAFSGDGDKVYLTNQNFDVEERQNTGTAFNPVSGDLTTLNYTLTESVQSVHFNPDGTRMLCATGGTTPAWRTFDLSTPWDLSTAVIDESVNTNAISGFPLINQYDAQWSPNGLVMYTMSSNVIYELSLATAFELTGATYTTRTINAGTGTAGGGTWGFEVAPDLTLIVQSQWGNNVANNDSVRWTTTGGAQGVPAENRFMVGDPSYPTEIDGTRVGLKNNIGINWDNTLGENVELAIFTAVVLPQPTWTNVEYLADFDGTDGQTTYTTVDDNARALTNIGTELDDAQAKFGPTSTYFDGNNDSWTSNDNGAISDAMVNNDWCCEGWMYNETGTFARGGHLLCGAWASLADLRQFNIAIIPSGEIQYEWSTTGTVATTTQVTSTGANVGTTGVWHHIAVSYDNTNTTLRMFANGVKVYENTSHAGVVVDSSGNSGADFVVGRIIAFPENDYPHKGWLDDVRVVVGETLYFDSFTPPTQAHPIGAGNQADQDTGSYILGDPNYQTKIDGSTTTITGAAQLDSTLNVVGATTLRSTLGVTGNATFDGLTDFNGLQNDINGGNLNWYSPDGLEVMVTNMGNDGVFRFEGTVGDEIVEMDAVDLRLRDDRNLLFGTNSDISFDYDQTDFNTVFTNTTDWNISGLAAGGAIRTDSDVVSTAGGFIGAGTLASPTGVGASVGFDVFGGEARLFGYNWTTAQFISTELYGEPLEIRTGVGGATSVSQFTTAGQSILGGLYLRIQDSTNSDWAEFSHDGTDFNTTFVTTTDWNITGATGAYIFDNDIAISGADNKLRFQETDVGADLGNTLFRQNSSDLGLYSATDAAPDTIVDAAWIARRGTTTTWDRFDFGNDVAVRIWDSTGSDYREESHGGTDFASIFVNTVDWDITGLTGEVFIDADLRTSGDLTVGGTTTTINSNTVSIADNIILLNSDEVGAPTENAGIEVERGTSANVSLLWNETTDVWFVADPFAFDGGAVGAPGITWVGDENTGFYQPAPPGFGVSIDGANTMNWQATYTQSVVEFWSQQAVSVNNTVSDVGQTGVFGFIDVVSGTDVRVGAYNYDVGPGWEPIQLSGISATVNAIGDGSFNLPGDNTANFTGLGNQLDMFDGMDLVLWDAGDTDNVRLAHDGTHLRVTETQTDGWIWDGDFYVQHEPAASTNAAYRRSVATGSANSTDGFFRIASNPASAGRGACRITVSNTGGTGAPSGLIMDVSASYSAVEPNVTVINQDFGAVANIRSGYDSVSGDKFIDIDVTNGTDATYVVVVEAYGFDGGSTWLAEVTTAPTPAPTSSTTIDLTPLVNWRTQLAWYANSNVTGFAGVFSSDTDNLTGIVGPSIIAMPEIANSVADTAAWGQLWVRDDAPNVLMFTDDTGVDWNLLDLGGGGALPAGTATNNSLRWNGSAWVEEDEFTISSSGVIESSNHTITNAQPKQMFIETDAGVDEQSYMLRTQGGTFGLFTATDAAPSTVVNTIFQTQRTGTTHDEIRFFSNNVGTIVFDRQSATNASGVAFANDDGVKGYLGFQDDESFSIWDTGVVEILNLSNAGVLQIDAQLRAGGGSSSEPGLSFFGETNTGFYRPAANRLGIAVTGEVIGEFTSNSATTNGNSWPSVSGWLEMNASYGIAWEDGNHAITNNDGGGNFNIRSNSYYNAGDLHSTLGKASHIEFSDSDDNTVANIEFNLSQTKAADTAMDTGQKIYFYNSQHADRGMRMTGGTIQLAEMAASNADDAGYGQFWVRNDTPNTPMFTSDDGTDYDLTAGGLWTENADVAEYLTGGTSGGIRFGRNANENIDIIVTDGNATFSLDQDETDSTTHQMIFNIESANTGERGFVWQDNAVTKFAVDHLDDYIYIRDGYKVRIYDSADTDAVDIYHNGTDLYFDHTNTQWVRWRAIAGGTSGHLFQDGAEIRIYHTDDVSYLRLHADATQGIIDVGTATSIRFDDPVYISNDSAFRVEGSLTSIYTEFDRATSEMTVTPSGAGNGFWFRTGTELRVYESANTDYLNIEHDGTDAIFGVSGTGALRLQVAGTENALVANANSYTSLYHNNSEVARTNGLGGMQFGQLNNVGVDYIHIYHDGSEGYINAVGSSAELFFRTGSISRAKCQVHTTTGETTGMEVIKHDGVFYDVGLNQLPVFNDDVSDTLEAQHCGAINIKDNTTARTLTLEASSSTDFPTSGVTQLVNAASSGDWTVNEGTGTTLYYIEPGTGIVDTAGGCTVGPGGVVTIWRRSGSVYWIWGSEITA